MRFLQELFIRSAQIIKTGDKYMSKLIPEENRICFNCDFYKDIDPDTSWCYCHNYETYALQEACPCFERSDI